MTKLVTQENQVVARSLLIQMAGQVPKIQAGEELGSIPLDGVVPAVLPRARREGALLGLIYHLHYGY